MGSAKTYRRQQSSGKERRAHTSGPKETFPTDESSVGSKKKSYRRQKITYNLRPMRVYRLAADFPLARRGLRCTDSLQIGHFVRSRRAPLLPVMKLGVPRHAEK
jgi:hypothetical protein